MTVQIHRLFRAIGIKFIIFWILACGSTIAQVFVLPTPNQAIYDWRSPEKYFAPVPGRSWESGTFGCVRSDGWQMHEGLDILCVQRDKHGKPIDPIFATADGQVVYVNDKAGLSNYGKYIVIKHYIDGLEIYSLYAHLSEILSSVKPGKPVKAGEQIAVMGTTSNTRQKITLDRAHLHFELNFFINDNFAYWFKAKYPGERNDHGIWNGQNLIGVDPRMVLLLQRREGNNFSLRNYILNQDELCSVFVRSVDFPYLKRYSALIIKNPTVEKEGVAGYELVLNYNGLPFRLIPRAPSETRGYSKIQLISVNAAEQKRNPCRKLVFNNGTRWELSNYGVNLIELLTYTR